VASLQPTLPSGRRSCLDGAWSSPRLEHSRFQAIPGRVPCTRAGRPARPAASFAACIEAGGGFDGRALLSGSCRVLAADRAPLFEVDAPPSVTRLTLSPPSMSVYLFAHAHHAMLATTLSSPLSHSRSASHHLMLSLSPGTLCSASRLTSIRAFTQMPWPRILGRPSRSRCGDEPLLPRPAELLP